LFLRGGFCARSSRPGRRRNKELNFCDTDARDCEIPAGIGAKLERAVSATTLNVPLNHPDVRDFATK